MRFASRDAQGTFSKNHIACEGAVTLENCSFSCNLSRSFVATRVARIVQTSWLFTKLGLGCENEATVKQIQVV